MNGDGKREVFGKKKKRKTHRERTLGTLMAEAIRWKGGEFWKSGSEVKEKMKKERRR